MSANDRKEFIIEKLNENELVKVSQLSKELKVTRETIRRDLHELELAGLIKKVHGGAVLDATNQESSYEKRQLEMSDEKKRIAKKAAEYIEDGDTIYLDYGTTTFAIAKELKNMKNITVVTNTIPIVSELMSYEEIDIIIPGGSVRRNEGSLYGTLATNNIKDIFVNIGFFGCSGIDSKIGVTSHHMVESAFSKEMFNHCQQAIVVTDSTKFEMVAFNRVSTFEKIDTIITDSRLPEEVEKVFRQQDVDLCLV